RTTTSPARGASMSTSSTTSSGFSVAVSSAARTSPSFSDSHCGDGTDVSGRHADADLELTRLDQPIVRGGIPERKGAAVEHADHRRALAGSERDLRERAQLLLGAGNGCFGIVHVALHDLAPRE